MKHIHYSRITNGLRYNICLGNLLKYYKRMESTQLLVYLRRDQKLVTYIIEITLVLAEELKSKLLNLLTTCRFSAGVGTGTINI